ncbi:MAG: UDP-N-acetylmuramate--L-alanine ligase [Bacteroidetes bacterium GWF2_42_66]|nr:MAG: UDP-N-acetylmuramate--L-alanine ligase [Bacteroidetes bacterium GWA2_42_15]OFY00172.1 MAG: UDP-N-acetylmuramate--L-alanine ligase [Bacteroidetes bacterium GWE2_42_39]OFY40314.1 MAG: UDP-N-acetylmuramate--L-alanine ligase [Bacteroidetes bacterium GWF2_42_66]HBL73701.1 UDP-N-acetylmuramate--L-alanine ligase [Prolixibacteraceae bacterium]HCR90711.1 UDP-N-acetylmuramate--L-alanine ligase [Prolixibacteraceae bacterium]
MQDINKIEQVYFLGIGGIGMSALARYFKHLGKAVSGYDRVETELTRRLQAEGINVHYTDDPATLPHGMNPGNTLVVLTPAIPASHREYNFLKENNFSIKKRSQVLGIICNPLHCIAVSGTHGKTSVSTMIAHILKNSSLDCSAILGGISKNYQTNLLLAEKETPFIVTEADEFDRSFLQLQPTMAVVTSMDADHLEIYGTHEAIIEAFNQFVSQVKPGGVALVKKGLKISESTNQYIRHYSYSLSEQADFYAQNIRLMEGAYQFDLFTPDGIIPNFVLNYPGLMNVENAVAASAMALMAGAGQEEVKTALATYQGVKRRFDIHLRTGKYILIDDYAHHPEELKATITSVRDMYKGAIVTGIFQPHLFSRTSDLADGFAKSLDLLDEVVLMDIYPAREEPIPGVTSDLVFRKIKNNNKVRCTKAELPELARNFKPGIILMMGAGDIDTMVEKIKNILTEKKNA